LWRAAASAAISGVQVVIGGPNEVARRITERPGCAVNGSRGTLKLKEDASGRFIQVQMQARKPETRAILLVAEPRTKAQGAKNDRPAMRVFNYDLALEALFIAAPARHRGWGLGRQDRPCGGSKGFPGGSEGFRAKAEHAAATSQVRAGRVEKRVLLEEAPARDSSEAMKRAKEPRDVLDSKLDFNFERCAPPSHD
jgi:hypothetical protein